LGQYGYHAGLLLPKARELHERYSCGHTDEVPLGAPQPSSLDPSNQVSVTVHPPRIIREETTRHGRPAIRWVLRCAHGVIDFVEDAAYAHPERAIVLLELIPAHDEIYGDEACTDYLWDCYEGFRS
jgi:hypothetical protein